MSFSRRIFFPRYQGDFLLQSLPPGAHKDEGCEIRGTEPLRWLFGNLKESEGLATLNNELCKRAGSEGALVGTVDYSGCFTFGIYDRIEITRSGSSIIHLSPDLSGGAAGEVVAKPGLSGYKRMVEIAQEEIAAGNIYQVNLSRQFVVPWWGDAAPLYIALARRSPAPFAAFIRQPERTVISASPELFLRVRDKHVQTRPIKGTRPRGRTKEEDMRLREELEHSPKERAELVMITDLLRNDLGRVCLYGSVKTEKLAVVESFEQVHHLVSTVSGCINPGLTPFDLLAAMFPGGSITGAPKLRAMSVISALEPFDRGLFTGAIGLVTFRGQADFSIAIRTAIHRQSPKAAPHSEEVIYHAGSGIVADSSPDAEFEETEVKAAGFLEAVRDCT